MLIFDSSESLSQLDKHEPIFPIVKDLVDRLIIGINQENFRYEKEADGFIAVITEDDLSRNLIEIWPEPDSYSLFDLPFEGVLLQDGYWKIIYLANNSYGILFILEDAPWLKGELRDILEEHLDP